ncbi:MAG: glycosyltransferase family 2 protein [Patescibacteria group bacterium]
MNLSILIPTKNEENNIGRLLESIVTDNSFDPTKVEVIVVDNPGTTDKTREVIARYSEVKLIIEGNERSSQRNIASQVASSNFIMFLDADMQLSKGLLKEVLEFVSMPSAGDFIGIFKESVPGKSLYCQARDVEKFIYQGNDNIEAARLFYKPDYEKLGGFDVNMVSGEDWHLDRRFRNIGKKVVRFQNPVLHYEEDLGFWGAVKKKIYYAKNLKNYKVGLQTEVNPFYRIGILFSKPSLIFRKPLAFIYLICLKLTEFGVGFIAYVTNK